MTDPITPPPELVQEWACASPIQHNDESWAYELFIAHRAAQWGADQELEACCEWLNYFGYSGLGRELPAARRPKPPSLKEQSLALIDLIQGNKKAWDISDLDVVRRALEALPND
jgi:hypothetical protein